METLNYINNGHGLKSWLLTKDHKRIALLYLVSITFFFFLGGLFAFMIRLELLTPAGDLLTAENYNKMFTMHGVVMVFFFLIPSIPAVLGNFLLPIMIGAKDLAFPRINLLSWYIYVLGGIFTLVAALSGGVDTGWTFYTPYSTAAANSHVITAALGVFITGFSSILTGLNFIVTMHRMRAPGMTWFRLPLFVWAHYATSLIMILGTPVIAITVLLVAAERALHMGIFDPALGGDPVLFQHLFWFYSPPGGLHHDPAGDGRDQRDRPGLLAQEHLRLFVHRVLIARHRDHRLPRVGPPHLRRRPVGVCGDALLDPLLHGRGAVGDQGVQLDGDDLSRLGQPRFADAVRVRLPRAVHDRRADRPVPRGDGARHPRARHLLRRRALPLHHGRRRDHGLPRRDALLVAEDDREDVHRAVGEARRAAWCSSGST